MSELEPLFGWLLGVLCVSAIPAALITWIWGGRGVFYFFAVLGLATAAFLIWVSITGTASTGMEGLAYVIWPLIYVAACVGAVLGFSIVRILKPK